MVGSTYKILAKCLVLRQKEVEDSRAFLKGPILDGVLCANECIDSHIREGISGVICKLDMEEACNYVNWRFMYDILGCFGFGIK